MMADERTVASMMEHEGVVIACWNCEHFTRMRPSQVRGLCTRHPPIPHPCAVGNMAYADRMHQLDGWVFPSVHLHGKCGEHEFNYEAKPAGNTDEEA